MDAPASKPRQVLPLFANVCSLCGFPIRPGPGFEDGSQAHAHRLCLKLSVHDEAVASECHDLWLDAYALLCRGLPQAETDIIPLATEYQDRLHPDGYLDFLARALGMIANQALPDNDKQGLIRRVSAIRDKITELAQTKTPLHS